jgi:hypothetical protein
MNKLIKELEDIMVAITFAEAGEYDEARKRSEKTASIEQEGFGRPLQEFKKTALESTGK